jgi:heme oxygenase
LNSDHSASPPRGCVGNTPRPERLSAELRAATSELHQQIERLIDLPDCIVTRDDYRRWIARFYGFYQPLESALTKFSGWDGLGVCIGSRLHSPDLAHDLDALGCAAPKRMLVAAGGLPNLPSLAHALGALYVLEGATLGGQIILRRILSRPDLSIGAARQFFGGRGREVGPMWQEFRDRLDDFGLHFPMQRGDVVVGAQRTFQALLTWVSSTCPAEITDSEVVNFKTVNFKLVNSKACTTNEFNHEFE